MCRDAALAWKRERQRFRTSSDNAGNDGVLDTVVQASLHKEFDKLNAI